MDKLLLKPSEAAELVGLGRSTFYGLVKAGTIPSIRVGRSIRIPLAALRQWVSEQVDSPFSTARTGRGREVR